MLYNVFGNQSKLILILSILSQEYIEQIRSQKLGFLSIAHCYFSPSQLLTIYKYQIRPAFMSGVVLLNLLSIFLTESSLKLSVSSTIQTSPVLSHRRLVADLSIFYRYFLRKSRILFLIQWGVLEPAEALPIHTLSKLHYLIHEL